MVTERRRQLEREISTLLWTLDALEGRRREPEPPPTLEPELADAADALSAAVHTLRALPPAT